MTPKEEQAVDTLRSGIGWEEAKKRTGFTVERLKQLFQQYLEAQQAKNDAVRKIAGGKR